MTLTHALHVQYVQLNCLIRRGRGPVWSGMPALLPSPTVYLLHAETCCAASCCRQTEGFSCSELVQLCQLAARRAAQEVGGGLCLEAASYMVLALTLCQHCDCMVVLLVLPCQGGVLR